MLERLTESQLAQDNTSYLTILPSLLWSTVALNFSHTEFTRKAFDLCVKHVDWIPFASKVLLSQVYNTLADNETNSMLDLVEPEVLKLL